MDVLIRNTKKRNMILANPIITNLTISDLMSFSVKMEPTPTLGPKPRKIAKLKIVLTRIVPKNTVKLDVKRLTHLIILDKKYKLVTRLK